ncbi:MAG: SlyX family protein [Candidatus Sedimenticola sp. (ex Thyasira tokunagai)]
MGLIRGNPRQDFPVQDDIIDLQTRLAFQEDALQELTLTTTHQQNLIDMLQRKVLNLEEQLRSLEPQEGMGTINERPPHY